MDMVVSFESDVVVRSEPDSVDVVVVRSEPDFVDVTVDVTTVFSQLSV